MIIYKGTQLRAFRYIKITSVLIILFITKNYAATVDSLLNNNNRSYFIENKGQWPKPVKYLTKLNGQNIWIHNNHLLFDFYKFTAQNEQQKQILIYDPEDKFLLNQGATSGQIIDMQFIEPKNDFIHFEGKNKLLTYHNYFLGKDSSGWASNVPLYSSVYEQNIYDGIDVRYYFENKNLRFDIIVNPNSDPNKIRLEFNGQDNLEIDNNNDIILSTILGKIKIAQLTAYQLTGNTKQIVDCKFVIENNNSIKFLLGDYNTDLPLIIDPLIYSTFIGGNGDDCPYSLFVDQNGAVYQPGATTSSNYPIKTGAYQNAYSGSSFDCFISKLNPSGNNLIFSTYLGGNGLDYGIGLTLDGKGYLYVTGRTFSTNFPTSIGAFQTINRGQDDAFLTKFDTSGSTMIFSTYIGGNSYETAHQVKIDKLGNPVVVGWTASTNFPTTPSAFQNTNGGGPYDVFIAKLNQSGTALIFSSYLGGSYNEDCWDFKIDAYDNIYSAGFTYSSNFPTSSAAYQKTFGGGADIFVTKINPNCTSLIYSTFVGGSGEDIATGIVLDKNSNAYCIGNSTSTNFPVTSGVFQSTKKAGAEDVVIFKIDSSGSSLLKSTYLGGTGVDYGRSIDLDASGNIFASGQVGPNFPVTPCAFQTTFGGDTYDRFLSKINPPFTTLLYSTYIGGNKNDISQHDNVKTQNQYCFVSGSTQSANFPVTSGSYQTTYSGGLGDVFVLKLDPTTNYTLTSNPVKLSYCAGSNVSVPFIVTCPFNSGNTFTAQLSDSIGNFSTTITIDSVSGTGSGTINGNIPSNIKPGTKYRIRVVSSNSPFTGQDNGVDITIYPLPNAGFVINDSIQCLKGNNFLFTNKSATGPLNYKWYFGNNDSSIMVDPGYSFSKAGQYIVTLLAISSFGCKDTITRKVLVIKDPVPDYNINDTIQCLGNNLFIFNNLTDTSQTGFKWDFGDAFYSTNTNTSHSYNKSGNYSIKLIATISNLCSDSIFKKVSVLPGTKAGFLVNDSVQCLDNNSFLFTNLSDTIIGNVSFNWVFGDGYSDQNTNTQHNFKQPGTFTINLTASAGSGCRDSVFKTVIILPNPLADFSFDSNKCNSDINFINHSSNANKFLWDFGDGSNSTDSCPIHTYDIPGKYLVHLYANYNKKCIDSIVYSVDVQKIENRIYVPNAFTPNGDNLNEFFKVSGWDPDCSAFQMLIYNRWGQNIFDSRLKKEEPVWDGFYKGKKVSPGVYIFILLGEKWVKCGTVTVIY